MNSLFFLYFFWKWAEAFQKILSSFNLLQSSVVFCTLYSRGYTAGAPLLTVWRAKKVSLSDLLRRSANGSIFVNYDHLTCKHSNMKVSTPRNISTSLNAGDGSNNNYGRPLCYRGSVRNFDFVADVLNEWPIKAVQVSFSRWNSNCGVHKEMVTGKTHKEKNKT